MEAIQDQLSCNWSCLSVCLCFCLCVCVAVSSLALVRLVVIYTLWTSLITTRCVHWDSFINLLRKNSFQIQVSSVGSKSAKPSMVQIMACYFFFKLGSDISGTMQAHACILVNLKVYCLLRNFQLTIVSWKSLSQFTLEINIAVVTRLQIYVKVMTDQNRDNQFWFCMRYSQHKINRSTNFSQKIAILLQMTKWPWYSLSGSWKVKGHVATCKIKHMFVYVDNTNLPSILNDFQDIKHFVIFQLWPLKVRDFSWSCLS